LLKKVLLGMLVATGVHAQTYPNHWPQVARTDLDFVHQTLKDNHPGAIDRQNPYFKEWMERGYAEASAKAGQAASLEEAARILKRYAAGFADIHLQIGFNQQSRQVAWPGLIIGHTGKRYVVSGRAQAWPAPLPAVQAELLSCDGRTPDTMMNEDILPGLYNLTSSDAIKSMFMFHFFYDNDMARHQYRRCVFSDAGGRKEIDLQWQPVRTAEYDKQWRAANPPLGKQSSISELAPGKYWVHLPEFNPDPDQEESLKKLIAQVAGLRAATLVVFDLRGNGGGNSQWGDDALENLYGAPYLAYLQARQGKQGYAEYRVSSGNLQHAEDGLATQTRQFGANSPNVLNDADLVKRMRKALLDGTPFVRQSIEKPPAALPSPPPAPLSAARAILVTDSDCVSSCLDFADAVMRLPNVRHFGQTTGADTLFMEVRNVDLPSHLGSLTFSQKVYRGRLRGSNQPWVPSLQYPGQIADTGKLKAWVLEQAH
jgi:hypothetical protein